MNMKAELIINPRSRGAREALKSVTEEFKAHGIDISRTTKLRKHDLLSDVVRDALARKPKLLIVGGGDGTISDVVDHLAGSDVTLALLPLGTTNNFARSLNIPLPLP